MFALQAMFLQIIDLLKLYTILHFQIESLPFFSKGLVRFKHCFGKGHVLAENIWFCCHKHGRRN